MVDCIEGAKSIILAANGFVLRAEQNHLFY